jgi:hypothetical protein
VTDRLALRRDGTGITVLREKRIPLEAHLQEAFVRHPEALPATDLNLGPLTSIGWEINFGAGPLDQLAVDTRGQLVIVEFKKGTENSDVRQVVAQLLDYGSSLWRLSNDELQEGCRNNGACSLLAAHETIADHVRTLTSETVDREAFDRNLQACLEAGTFVFLYVVRDLDKATRRVLSYLAEGAGLRFYAVEIDHFGGDDESSILVPRVAYIPANVAAGEPPAPTPDPAADELMTRVDALADGVQALKSEKGRRWAVEGQTLLGVYTSSSGITFWLPELAAVAGREAADGLKARLQELFSERRLPAMYPAFYPSEFLERWDRGGADIVRHLFSLVVSAKPSAGRGDSSPVSP